MTIPADTEHFCMPFTNIEVVPAIPDISLRLPSVPLLVRTWPCPTWALDPPPLGYRLSSGRFAESSALRKARPCSNSRSYHSWLIFVGRFRIPIY
jgi:hypothetical protein